MEDRGEHAISNHIMRVIVETKKSGSSPALIDYTPKMAKTMRTDTKEFIKEVDEKAEALKEKKKPKMAPEPVKGKKKPKMAPAPKKEEVSSEEKDLAEIEALVKEAVTMAENGASRKELTEFYNTKILPKLSLYGGEYLPHGAAQEMSDAYFDEIIAAHEEASAKEKAEKKKKLDAYADELRQKAQEAEDAKKKIEEVKSEAKKQYTVSATQAKANFESPDMFELILTTFYGDKEKAKKMAEQIKQKYPGKRIKFYGRKNLNLLVERDAPKKEEEPAPKKEEVLTDDEKAQEAEVRYGRLYRNSAFHGGQYFRTIDFKNELDKMLEEKRLGRQSVSNNYIEYLKEVVEDGRDVEIEGKRHNAVSDKKVYALSIKYGFIRSPTKLILEKVKELAMEMAEKSKSQGVKGDRPYKGRANDIKKVKQLYKKWLEAGGREKFRFDSALEPYTMVGDRLGARRFEYAE
jgi:hypothetical protein